MLSTAIAHAANNVKYGGHYWHIAAYNTLNEGFLSDTLPGAEPMDILIQGTSRRYDVLYFAVPAMHVSDSSRAVTTAFPAVIAHIPLLKVSGNILYDVNYRSRIDTPYAENDVYQHTLQTRLDLVYKEQYPFRLYVTTRFSNSSLFRKYTDLNFQFSQSDFKRNVKQKMLEAVQSYLASQTGKLDSLKRLMEAKKQAIASLSQSLQRPDLTQKIVEEREKEILRKRTETTPPTIPVNADSIQASVSNDINKVKDEALEFTRFKDSIEAKKQKLDSLQTELREIENLYKKLKSAEQLNLAEIKKQIEGAKDVQVLTEKLHRLHLPDSILPKGYKTLYSIQSLGIGRSVADYSELSVKNISITGIQVEYNPRYYYALAVGKVDYRFRDYIVPNRTRTSQYLALARFGKGAKNGNHIILTYYTGKRQFFNASIASQSNVGIPEYNLAGITIEGFYKVNKNISVVGEVAKSTVPYYSLDSLQRKEWMSSVAKFNDRSNEAYSLKLFSWFPKTYTRFSGNIRYTGANFQSFSTFTTGASQLMWLARVEQPLFKKQLTIVSSLQQNDYNNPFVTTAYKSSSLLASFQANLRIKKWPVIMVGYYPSYQLTKAGGDQYSESRYYMVTGSAGYYYHLNNAQLSSYVVYSRFYNEMADSGFVYYNSKNWLLSQSATFNWFSVMMNASFSTGTDYNMYTIENSNQFTISKMISAGAGIKMIKYSLLPVLQWGYNANLTLKITRLGDIQLMMDKGFIPGFNRQLAENRMGRLTYYKTF